MKLTLNQEMALWKIAGNNFTANIPTVTLNSLAKRGLIERTGDFYHCLTEAGVRELYKERINKLDPTDPYEALETWCRENGYADVIDCEVGAVDSDRLHEAVDRYYEAGR